MSFRVLIIPEDPTYNGYILKPIIERMFGELGKPAAHVVVLTNPRLRGYTQATHAIRRDLPNVTITSICGCFCLMRTARVIWRTLRASWLSRMCVCSAVPPSPRLRHGC